MHLIRYLNNIGIGTVSDERKCGPNNQVWKLVIIFVVSFVSLRIGAFVLVLMNLYRQLDYNLSKTKVRSLKPRAYGPRLINDAFLKPFCNLHKMKYKTPFINIPKYTYQEYWVKS